MRIQTEGPHKYLSTKRLPCFEWFVDYGNSTCDLLWCVGTECSDSLKPTGSSHNIREVLEHEFIEQGFTEQGFTEQG